jgi:flagellum-specific peptidoglycan hydrolase FlgJ
VTALASWQQTALDEAIAAALAVETTRAQNGLVVPKALAPVSVAQFILESNWGHNHLGAANNYFGIKARDGEPFASRSTREFIAGRWTTVEARFRAFGSMQECFEAHAELLCDRELLDGSGKIYAAALSSPDDALAFAQALQGVYATDPEYAGKLIAIMRENDLIDATGASALQT